jgi:hypothetical protein
VAAFSADPAGAQRWEGETGCGRVVDRPGVNGADMVVVRGLDVADERLVRRGVAAGGLAGAGGEHEAAHPREGDARGIVVGLESHTKDTVATKDCCYQRTSENR